MIEALIVIGVVGYLVVLGVVLWMQPKITDDDENRP
jgi:hypothetical protein